MVLEGVGDGGDCFCRAEHALVVERWLASCRVFYFVMGKENGRRQEGLGRLTRLDNINPDILNDGVNLLSEKLGRHEVNVVDPLCVLRRESRRGRHGIAAVGGNHLLVCFEAAARDMV